METTGRRANNYQIESVDREFSFPLLSLIECDDIPNNRSEIPTPDVALHYPHLKDFAHLIPKLETDAKIILLLGQDIIRIHKRTNKLMAPTMHHMPRS